MSIKTILVLRLILIFVLPVGYLDFAKSEELWAVGQEFKDCPTCPTMIVVPPGEFGMGAPPIDQGRPFAEGELRPVKISDSFAVGKFEVTIKEWSICVEALACPENEQMKLTRSDHPVTNVSWSEAMRFTKWLSKKTNRSYRLLTEAEWEYVARAGQGRKRFFGISLDQVCVFANLYDETAENSLEYGLKNLPCVDGYPITSPVGSFSPNSFGLYDTLGNVWEWTEDCQAILWRNAPTDASARVAGRCSMRAYRGGSWLSHPPKYIQIPDRYKYLGAREIDLGFRVARTLD